MLARAVAVVAAGSSGDVELAGLVPVLLGGGAEVRVTAPAQLLAAARLAERVSVACRAEGLRTRVSGGPGLVRVEPRQD